MVVVSCSGMGIIKSREIGKRYRLLREWQRLILLLTQEISYNVPLPEACSKVGEKAGDPFRGFLLALSRRLSACDGKTFHEIFLEGTIDKLSRSCLDKTDLESIRELGDMMGAADRRTQKQLLEHYGKELEFTIRELKEQLPGKQKLYRSLGILGGVFLGILLS